MPLRQVVLALFVFIQGCTCSEKAPTGEMKAPGSDQPGRPLSPLPEAPSLDVDPQAMPGSGQALTVVVARPKGAIEGDVRPTITFSRPVKSLEMVEAQRAADASAPIAKIEPTLEGEWRWLGSASASVEFVPKDLVPFSTAFKVTVPKGLRALDGASLDEDVTFEFQTPVLEVQEVAPANGFQWLRADQPIMILVNQPIQDSALLNAVSISIEGEAPIRAKLLSSISIQEERREEAKKTRRPYQPMSDEDRGFRNRQMRYTLAPSKPLPLGKRVTVKFDKALRGSEGTLPGKPFEDLEYRTYGELSLLSASMSRFSRRTTQILER